MAAPKINSYTVYNLKVDINRSECISCGSCSALAPKTFELDEDLICKVKDHNPYDKPEEIKDAASACPVEAIKITEQKSS